MPELRAVHRGALAAVTLLGALVTVPGCSTSPGSSAPSLSQVRDVLARHGAAVLDRSSAAFLADVDTAAESGPFRARQAAQIGALATVPLASWSYAVDAPVTNAATTDVASTRYHAPALIVRIDLVFRLDGPGQAATTKQLFWTFVRRHGATLLAGDDDEAGSGDVSWRGPWDFGAVSAVRGAASVVLAHPAQATALQRLAADADAAVRAVIGVVGSGWAGGVTIQVSSSPAEFTALTGGVTSGDVSAVTVFDAGGGTSGGAAIVMRPDALTGLTAQGLGVVLRHEVTHVATAPWTTPISPRWLIEGFADYVAHLGSDEPATTAAAELAAEVRAGRLPGALPADQAFAVSGTQAAVVYEQSWLACVYLATRIGTPGLVTFYRRVGMSTAPNDEAAGEVITATLHEPLATFVSQWREFMKAQLG